MALYRFNIQSLAAVQLIRVKRAFFAGFAGFIFITVFACLTGPVEFVYRFIQSIKIQIQFSGQFFN